MDVVRRIAALCVCCCCCCCCCGGGDSSGSCGATFISAGSPLIPSASCLSRLLVTSSTTLAATAACAVVVTVAVCGVLWCVQLCPLTDSGSVVGLVRVCACCVSLNRWGRGGRPSRGAGVLLDCSGLLEQGQLLHVVAVLGVHALPHHAQLLHVERALVQQRLCCLFQLLLQALNSLLSASLSPVSTCSASLIFQCFLVLCACWYLLCLWLLVVVAVGQSTRHNTKASTTYGQPLAQSTPQSQDQQHQEHAANTAHHQHHPHSQLNNQHPVLQRHHHHFHQWLCASHALLCAFSTFTRIASVLSPASPSSATASSLCSSFFPVFVSTAAAAAPLSSV